MDAVEKLTVTVPGAMIARVKAAVAGGAYSSVNDVVHEALRDWEFERTHDIHNVDDLRGAIQAGLTSGPGIRAEHVYAELHGIIAKKSKPSA